MIENLIVIMKKAVAGDKASSETILSYFEEHAVSLEEQAQIHLYLKQASGKSHAAIYLRAELYHYGFGTKVDLEMAFLLMREAAAKGNAKATYQVGHYFLEGLGVEKSVTNALQWLKIAAGSPHYLAPAMFDLGRIYEQNQSAEDLAVAKTWYEKALQHGDKRAAKKLSELK